MRAAWQHTQPTQQARLYFMIETKQLTYRVTGNRIEFRYDGVLISNGHVNAEHHRIDCITYLRRVIGGKFGDGSFEAAKAVWDARREAGA